MPAFVSEDKSSEQIAQIPRLHAGTVNDRKS
jgi:hypothetical protein